MWQLMLKGRGSRLILCLGNRSAIWLRQALASALVQVKAPLMEHLRPAKRPSISASTAASIFSWAAFMPRTLAKASSLSPWICSTGLRLSMVAMAAPAGVTRPPFFR